MHVNMTTALIAMLAIISVNIQNNDIRILITVAIMLLMIFIARKVNKKHDEIVETNIALTDEKIARETAILEKNDAESASQAKSIFLANMSHEIRTPLNAVLGYSQIMRRDKDFPAKYIESLDAVESAGNHLLGLINGVLDLSKIEADAMKLHEENFELVELVQSLASMFQIRCTEKHLDFRLSINVDIPCWVRGDQGKLRQILINFLGNAVKFTEEGGITLELNRLENNLFEFIVSDTGIGINEQDQALIFEPFQQACHDSYISGTGLGLAIAKKQIHMMNGGVSLHSEPGAGSKFSFTLRLESLIDDNSVEDKSEIRAVLEPGIVINALIIDPDEENRDVLVNMLMLSGIDVYLANTFEEAERLSVKQKLDIVFIDIPDSQLTTLNDKHNFHGQQLPVVLITSSEVLQSNVDKETLKIAHQLTKPLKYEALINTIESHLPVKFKREELKTAKTVQNDSRTNVKESEFSLPEDLRKSLITAAEHNALTDIESILDEISKISDTGKIYSDSMRGYLNRYDTQSIIDSLKA